MRQMALLLCSVNRSRLSRVLKRPRDQEALQVRTEIKKRRRVVKLQPGKVSKTELVISEGAYAVNGRCWNETKCSKGKRMIVFPSYKYNNSSWLRHWTHAASTRAVPTASGGKQSAVRRKSIRVLSIVASS